MYDIASTVSRVANSTYSHTRRIMPEQPWWETLESSFHKFPDDFELDLRTELTVDSTAVADYLLRTAGAGLLGSPGPAEQHHAAPTQARYGDHRFLPQQGQRRGPDQILPQAGLLRG